MTTRVEAVQAITSRISSLWAATPIAVDNEPLKPEPNTSWVKASIHHTFSEQETLGAPGNRRFMRKCFAQFLIVSPSHGGREGSDQLVQAMRNLFEGIEFSGITCFAFRDKEAGTDGLCWKVVAEAHFMYDEIK
jgi:hypothetical protein